jgi:phosphoribosyl 1,2-cyclic phosphate phosphodiesterase
MKFKYLGTAAAEGVPAMFCSCKVCSTSRKKGGRNLRSRSQAIIDDKLLIDFPPDTYLHIYSFGVDITNIASCIITHNHCDHLYPMDLSMRRVGFADLSEDAKPLTVYATNPSICEVQQVIDQYNLDKQGRVFAKEIKPYHSFEADGYVITALEAYHDESCMPVFYVISKDDKTILYANDTGYFPDSAWEYMSEKKVYFDFVSLDCTYGALPYDIGHMSFKADLDVRNRLVEMGCADKNTVFCSHHFSHNGKLTYDDLVPIAEKEGFLVAYDGMEIEI